MTRIKYSGMACFAYFGYFGYWYLSFGYVRGTSWAFIHADICIGVQETHNDDLSWHQQQDNRLEALKTKRFLWVQFIYVRAYSMPTASQPASEAS